MSGWVQDAGCAARYLLKRPRFAVVVVLALVLGIGPASAIFSVIYAVLLRPLPFSHPARLVTLWENNPKREVIKEPVDDGAFPYYREYAHAFAGMGGFWPYGAAFDLRSGGVLQPIPGFGVTAGLLEVLGVRPLRGRTFRPEECRPNGPYFLMLGYGLWMRQFGGDPGVVGKTLKFVYLDRLRDYTVVGVMPKGFEFPYPLSAVRAQAWACSEPYRGSRPLGGHNTHVVARLKPGITVSQAQADVASVTSWLARKFPRVRNGVEAFVVPAAAQSREAADTPILFLFAATGLILLIACSNVAALLLARGEGRRKEVAVRMALGAQGSRIVRQLLAESALLGSLAAVIAVVLDYCCLPLLTRSVPHGFFVPRLDEVKVNLHVLAFAVGVSWLAATFSSVLPAIRLSRAKLSEVLKDSCPGPLTRNRATMGVSLLVPGEIALAVLLLAAAGLMLKSLRNLDEVDLGFNPKTLLSVEMVLPNVSPGSSPALSFGQQFLAGVASLPGVRNVALVDSFPLGGFLFNFAEGHQKPGRGSAWPYTAELHLVTPGFFSIMGDALLKGRLLLSKDGQGSPMIAVINAQMAGRYWRGQDPLGKKITLNPSFAVPPPAYTIVGVIREHRRLGSNDEPPPRMYASFFQSPLFPYHALVQTGVRPGSLVGSIRRVVGRAVQDGQVVQATTGEDLFSDSVARPAFLAHMLALFAAFAWLLAALGTYGIVSYTTAERTHEVGIRMTVGASRADIVALVVGRAVISALIGVALGLVGAVLSAAFLRNLLYGVRPADPVALLASACSLVLTAIVAAYIPARRASRLDPAALVRRE
jgi:putative ABC transport system permease protein